jgi:hypothetical protein
VLRLLNIIATVLPDNAPSKFRGTEPLLIVFLCWEALRTRAVNSAGVRSAIERKCRGAKGETGGVVAVAEVYVRRSIEVRGLA